MSLCATPAEVEKALKLQPAGGRGMVLIDPSYEDKRDYMRVIAATKEAVGRFPSGTYAIWYPEVARRESQQFAGQLKRLAADFPGVLDLDVTVTRSQRLSGDGTRIAPVTGCGLGETVAGNQDPHRRLPHDSCARGRRRSGRRRGTG